MLWSGIETSDIARKVLSVNTRIYLFTFDFAANSLPNHRNKPNNTDSAVSPSIA